MSQMIHVIALLISLTNITLSQPTYDDAICNGSTILTVRNQPDVNTITGIPDTVAFNGIPYVITNPPPVNSGTTAAPQFSSSAVDPISGETFVILFVQNAVDSVPYLGTLDTSNNQVTIIYPAINVAFMFITGMTFDCMGNLFAFDRDFNRYYKIDINNANMTNVTLFQQSTKSCGSTVDCTDTIAFHWENELIYRVTSVQGGNHLLLVRQPDGTEDEYSINDTNALCFDVTSGEILALEYIGNDLFLIACNNDPSSIRLLDTSVLSQVTIREIGTGEIENDAGEWWRGIIPSDSNGNLCIPPASCTPLPTSNPTMIPSQTPTMTPSITCEDECDAFSVTVDDYAISNGEICIDYIVTRLSDEAPLCDANIKYLVLGLCEENLDLDIDSEDLNGIIRDFDVISSNKRVLESSDGSSDGGYRVVSGNRNGIKISVEVVNELQFRICLRNIFEEPIVFSDRILFNRGGDRIPCDGNDGGIEDIFDGLPCIDENIFSADSYDDSGYNIRFSVNTGGIKQKNLGSDSGESALISGRVDSNNNWGVLSELDPYVRWTLISIFVVSGVLIIIGAYICICNRDKKKEENELGDVVKQNRDVNNEGNSGNSRKGSEAMSDDEIVIENE